MVTLYLSGGSHSGWQDRVRNELHICAMLDAIRLLDPSETELDAPDQYTTWDLAAISQSDVVFANLEASNPGGQALCSEIGFARALGKLIILVDTQSAEDPDPGRGGYLMFTRECCDVVTEDFDEGIMALIKFLDLLIQGQP